MRESRLKTIRPTIEAWLENRPSASYSEAELRGILALKRTEWRIPSYVGTGHFIDFLLENTKLEPVKIVAPGTRTISDPVRYSWGSADPFLLGLSLRKRSYLTYSTALLLHGLTDQIPQTIFVTSEQRHKGEPKLISQTGIAKAFSKKQRESNLAYLALGYRYVIIEGSYIDESELCSLYSPMGKSTVQASGLERTLIDICVRPSYAGGIFQILEAYKRSRTVVNLSKLLSILRAHSYSYPYQQAIGFYLEKAGFSRGEVEPFHRMISQYDFYLGYALIETTYVPRWKLYVPRGFE